MKLTKEMVQKAYEEEINKGNQEKANETMDVIELHHNRMQETFDLLSKLA